MGCGHKARTLKGSTVITGKRGGEEEEEKEEEEEEKEEEEEWGGSRWGQFWSSSGLGLCPSQS
jgi:hypothetical protein